MTTMTIDAETERVATEFVDELIRTLPDALGITHFIPASEVVDLDPYSTGTTPRYIRVALRGEEYADVYWRGNPTLVVGDECTVIRFADGDRYEVMMSGGSTGGTSYNADTVDGAHLSDIYNEIDTRIATHAAAANAHHAPFEGLTSDAGDVDPNALERIPIVGGDGITTSGTGVTSLTIDVAYAGTPSTLTVATSNDNSGPSTDPARVDHTHAITTSSNPGSNAVILASNASGRLELEGLGIGASPTGIELRLAGNVIFVGAQNIDTTSGDLTIQAADDIFLDPDSNLVKMNTDVSIQSDGFASQTTGWRVTFEGEADFRYLFVDEMHAKAFIADLEQALAGGQIIAKSVSVVASDFSVPAAGSSGTLTVEDLPGGSGQAVFQSGDWVAMRQFSRTAGSLTIAWLYGTVSSYSDNGDGTQDWTFSRPSPALGTASGTIEEGTLALDFGTTGNGYYEVNAIDGAWGSNSPYAQIVTWNTDPTDKTVRARLGQLHGITSVDEYGLIAGGGVANTDQYFRFSDQNIEIHNIDIEIHDGTNEVFKIDYATPYYALGTSAPTAFDTGTGVWAGHDSGSYKWRVGDPSGIRVQWNGSQLDIYDDSNTVRFQVDADGAWLSNLALSTTLQDRFFSAADGLLLLGPGCPITSTSWTSLRGQVATISGAFHQVAGRWAGTRANLLEKSITNYSLDPIFGNSTLTTNWSTGQNGTGGTFARDTTHVLFGMHACKIVAGDGNRTFINESSVISLANGESVVFSVYQWCAVAGKAQVRLYDETNSTFRGSTVVSTKSGQWERLEVVWTNSTGGSATIRVYCENNAADSSTAVWFDGAQTERAAAPTSLVHGDLSWGAWSGTAHSSTSTRSKTQLDLSDLVDVISDNDTISISMWVQVPRAADELWVNGSNSWIFDMFETSGRVALRFNPGDDRFEIYLNSGWNLTGSTQTFAAGDWIHIVVTLDYSGDSYNLYVNGVLDGQASPSLSATSFTSWVLGSTVSYTEGYYANVAVGEMVVLDTVLTAEQVAGLYQRGTPLADTGAQDAPGIYILDGQFRIASSTSGSRIEIDSGEIAGYSGATKQFYLQASDGKAYFGGGADILDANGMTINTGTGDVNKIKWENGSGDRVGEYYAYESGGNQIFVLQTGHTVSAPEVSRVELVALGPSGYDDGQITLRSAYASSDAEIEFDVGGAYDMQLSPTRLDMTTIPIMFDTRSSAPSSPPSGKIYLYGKDSQTFGGGANTAYDVLMAKFSDGTTAIIAYRTYT